MHDARGAYDEDPFAEFRRTYPAHPPRKPEESEDELVLMTAEQGRRVFGEGAPTASALTRPPSTDREHKAFCNLWVIGTDDAAFAAETCDFAAKFHGGLLKHTNLTGGADAHSGGEIFFLNDGRVFINGLSGRYGAQESAELRAAGAAIAAAGYEVGMVPYDGDLDRPPRIVSAKDQMVWFK